MSKQPPPAPTASAVGPCPTVIKIVGRPGTESLPRIKNWIIVNSSKFTKMDALRF